MIQSLPLRFPVITQEEMQQQQFENYKQLLPSVRDKQIEVVQEYTVSIIPFPIFFFIL